MNKSELRKKYKEIRGSIRNREQLAEEITNKILRMPEYVNANTVGIYNSFGSEVDTSKLIKHALSNDKTVGVPAIDEEDMDFYRINCTKDIENGNSMGIGEPLKNRDNCLEPKSFDLLIIPGLCFDLENNRLGFGKGYYDRYLSNKEVTAAKIGICFDEQVLKADTIKTEAYDVKMDKVVY